MEARVIKSGVWWYGEVYGTWTNIITGREREGWNKVTTNCNTKLGAMLELRKWKREHFPKTFKI